MTYKTTLKGEPVSDVKPGNIWTMMNTTMKVRFMKGKKYYELKVLPAGDRMFYSIVRMPTLFRHEEVVHSGAINCIMTGDQSLTIYAEPEKDGTQKQISVKNRALLKVSTVREVSVEVHSKDDTFVRRPQ
jgi:hypothetical protein